MRPRVRTDWDRDLNERHALETDVANAIATHAGFTLEANNTASLNECDYHARDDRGRVLTIELKTRRQNYSTGWCTLRPETRPADLFIIDELAVRTLINRAPHAYVLIADLTAPVGRWIIFSVGDLLVIDRTRVTRPLTTTRGATVNKGKWLIDLADAPIVEERLDDALDELSLLTRTVDICWNNIAPWPTRRTTTTNGAAA